MADAFRVNIAREALADLDLIADFIERDSPDRARQTVRKILDAAHSLANLPRRFKIVSRSRRRSSTIHAFVVDPYILYYRVDAEGRTVQVVRIKHGRQRRTRRFP